ncbi:amidase family protein [Shewanella surugensis]|uniref:Amidase n=1 Tax=Shewanella surugensis TaxID=212020 RepID=A0ABT0LAS5_9GAMM|nr:amidase family protein [Shewanella surugensis]MCL1124745.1 amidase [Shewanella surugensis]
MNKIHGKISVGQNRRNDPAIFCEHGPSDFNVSDSGPLAGKRLAVKDVFQLKGEKNTAGSPDWFNTHPAANKTAESLSRLLNVGATFIGFTHLDELAYSMQGNNRHYGAAENPRVPGYCCGGSSMGSAAAVASGLADIALGTDTGGSVRVPASYCGLFGIRTSHSLVSVKGVIGLAPCFDTVGWFTQKASLLNGVGEVLLPKQSRSHPKITRLVICDAINQLADKHIQDAMTHYVSQVQNEFDVCETVYLSDVRILSELADVFRILQGRAIANEHGEWIEKVNPVFSADVEARLAMAMSISDDEVLWAVTKRQQWCRQMEILLPDETSVLLMPTSASTALKKSSNLSISEQMNVRQRLLGLTAIGGLWGAPQCHLPLFSVDEIEAESGIHPDDKIVRKPSGFSLLMAPNNDLALLALVEQVASLSNE